MKQRQFEMVDCSRGAPMGRPHFCDDPTARVNVFRVNMVDGDYDDGGAYWGGYPSEPLYCARDDAGAVQLFVRAPSIKQAMMNLSVDHPGLRFKGHDFLAEG